MESQPHAAALERPPGDYRAPRISVALCTHNGAAHIEEQLRSILLQSPAPAEVVIGDDASSDDTLSIIDRTIGAMREALPGLRTHVEIIRRAPALGVVGNFEATIGACTGDLIALSDQDDRWRPGKLAALSSLFAADGELLLAHSDAHLVDGDGASLGLTLLEALEATPAEREGLMSGAPGSAFAVLLRRNLVTGATIMFRRELVEASTPFAADWVHDEWLATIAAAVGSVRLLPDPLIDYRQHGANQIGARKPTMADRWARLRESRAERAPRLIRRADALVARLDRLADEGLVDRARVDAARSKRDHEAARADLPRWRPARIPGIVAGAARGRYARYSRGSIDIVRDLVQPAGTRETEDQPEGEGA